MSTVPEQLQINADELLETIKSHSLACKCEVCIEFVNSDSEEQWRSTVAARSKPVPPLPSEREPATLEYPHPDWIKSSEHLMKRMFDECGWEKASEFVKRVAAGEYDVPSPWQSQPSPPSMSTGEPAAPIRPRLDFWGWWRRIGNSYDPDTEDVPWYDKRKFLAEKAFDAGVAQSTNYTATEEVHPWQLAFANGRTVSIAFEDGEPYLEVGLEQQLIVTTAAPSKPSLPAGVSKIFGTWPGDETDEQLLGALEEYRTPSLSPEMKQLVGTLRELAAKSIPGPWAYQEESDAYTHIVRQGAHPNIHGWVCSAGQSSSPATESTARFIAEASPENILKLLDLVSPKE